MHVVLWLFRGEMTNSQEELVREARERDLDSAMGAFSFEAKSLSLRPEGAEYVFSVLREGTVDCRVWSGAAEIRELRESSKVGTVGIDRSLPCEIEVEVYVNSVQLSSAIILRVGEKTR